MHAVVTFAELILVAFTGLVSTGEPVAAGPDAVVRTVLESLEAHAKAGQPASIGELRAATVATEVSTELGPATEHDIDIHRPVPPRPDVIDDTLPPRVFLKAVRGPLVNCYATVKPGGKPGKIVVEFVLADDGKHGKVESAKIVEDTLGHGVGSCIRNVVKAARFPRPLDRLRTRQTFYFYPGD